MKKLIQSFDYDTVADWFYSLMPSIKYKMLSVVALMNLLLTSVESIFGINVAAFIALLVVMITEVVSGIYAAHVKQESFSSVKFSRFTFKCAIYLVLIAVPYLFSVSYKAHGNSLASGLFEWMHVFLVIQIVTENIISILENIAVIQGRPKTYWINRIKEKIFSL